MAWTESDLSDPGQWLTPRQAAELTGRSEPAIRRLLSRGELSGQRRGHRWVLPRETFLAQIAKR